MTCPRCGYERGSPVATYWHLAEAWLDEWAILTPHDLRMLTGLDAVHAKDLLNKWLLRGKLKRVDRGVYARASQPPSACADMAEHADEIRAWKGDGGDAI